MKTAEVCDRVSMSVPRSGGIAQKENDVTRAASARFTGACVLLLSAVATFAQAPATQQPPAAGAAPAATPPQGRGRGGPTLVSPEIGADGRVTFRVLAPQATVVTVGGDINGGLVPDPNPPAAAPAPRRQRAPPRRAHEAAAVAARRP